MAQQDISTEDAIVRLVQAWPREQQLHLVHRILASDDTATQTIDPRTGRPYISSTELRGIAAGNRPAPTDEDIERWRLEKYVE